MKLDREDYFFTPRYTRGQVCKVMNVTKDTLRYYEGAKLLSPAEQKSNHYKLYSIADLELLNVILFLRSIEIPVQDIPKFIECSDMQTYGDFLEEQIEKVTRKIAYWTQIKNLLQYLKDTFKDYQNAHDKVTVVTNVTFRYLSATFDSVDYDIEQMTPSATPTTPTYHIVKLKIIPKTWWETNRENLSGIRIGYLCDDRQQNEDITTCTIKEALSLNTLAPLEKIPEIIANTRLFYSESYEFIDDVYMVEHTFFNVFTQDALLRTIYLPISHKK